MPTITRDSGVRVTLPEDLRLVDQPDSRSRRLARGPAPAFERLSGASGPADELGRVAQALAQQDLEVLDTLPLEPSPAAPGTTRQAAAEPTREVAFEVMLEPDEEAVVLLEQDGMYTWQFEAERAEAAVPPGRRRRGAGAPRQATFRIRLAAAPATAAERRRRGFLSDLVVEKAQAIIFKFAGRFLLGQATAFLERHVKPGLVVMDGDDPTAWAFQPDFSKVSLPEDRPSRILLFVHGTFSSTKGGFGGLAATAWGRAFLAAARANYDAVLGFDHPTLSVDPRSNATEILRSLEARPWAQPAHIDVICHSRGAITLRSLTEYLLPSASVPVQIERVIFVGGVNAGTRLADPGNWKSFIDLYTNLAVGACRAMALFPQAAFAAALMGELLKSVGVLAKVLVKEAVAGEVVPGLASMAPEGPFIRDLNTTQPGQPSAADCHYYAVTSVFKASLALDSPNELPKKLLQALAGGFADQLFHEANDLVVHTASMIAIDPQAGPFIKDTLAFGENGTVYHTNYFLQPAVANALARWLELGAPGDVSPANRRGLIEPGTLVTAPAPALVDTDTVVLQGEDMVESAAEAIERQAPSYVVIERHRGGELLRYGFPAEDILAATAISPNQSLAQALDLHERGASLQRQARSMALGGGAEAGPALVPGASSGRTVVLEGAKVLGVTEPSLAPKAAAELAALEKQITRASRPADRVLARRAMPTLTPPSVAAPAPGLAAHRKSRGPHSEGSEGQAESAPHPSPPGEGSGGEGDKTKGGTGAGGPAAAAQALCHFVAEMEDEIVVGETASIDVTLSREVIAAVKAISAESGVPVAVDRKLIVDLIAKKNFEPAGDTRAEVDVPKPEAPEVVVFDVRATTVGEGEVWIRIRQGPQPLATLVLVCRLVATRCRRPVRRPQSASVVDQETPPSPLHQLTVFEIERGGKFLYQFILDSPTLGWKHTFESKPLAGRREDYINHIYEDIENRWLSKPSDFDQFQIELREIGAGLWDELLPAELQQALWERRDQIQSILVFSEEPFIPWELVHLKEPGKALGPGARFLGEMGVVRWQHNVGWPVEKLWARAGRCRYVIPHYPLEKYQLKEAEAEALFLEKHFNATAVEPHAGPVREVLAGPGFFDLLHFACHGTADSGDIARAELLLEGRLESGGYVTERLRASTIEQSANLGAEGTKPMVFLNACQAGRAGLKLTSIGGFARAFLSRGAGMFVGALWSVGDQPARTFMESLYRRLLAGEDLATASATARQEAHQAREATWLAYTVYGNPHAKLTN